MKPFKSVRVIHNTIMAGKTKDEVYLEFLEKLKPFIFEDTFQDKIVLELRVYTGYKENK